MDDEYNSDENEEEDEEEEKNEENVEENKKKFYFKQKSIFLTYSQCDLDKKKVYSYCITKFNPIRMILGKGKHKDGGFHFHIWMEFEDNITIRDSRHFDILKFHPNISKLRNINCHSIKSILKYILKDDSNPFIFGDIDIKSNKRNIIGKKVINGDNINDIIEEYPEEIYNYDKLIKNSNLFFIRTQIVSKHIKRKCFWIYGKSGVGKSYLVRESFDEIYEKENNLWWDGYSNESVVLIDDLDKSWLKLSYYLKIWGDNYRFKAQIKGGVIQPIYKKLIITSNYSIEYLFTSNLKKDEEPDNELIDAIKRRFEEIEMVDKDQRNEIINKLKLEYD